MSERRFTDKPELNPQAVRSLDENHPAMVENRTLFPSTVVEVTADEPEHILISGRDNRKIGATVEKGAFKGYSIFCLSLEERATCPTDCSMRSVCFGNGMQYGRRHRIGDSDVFFDRLGLEIVKLLDDHEGLLIRLHVLGDFPSVEYVQFWKEVLDEYPNVACFGYTHRSPTNWGGDKIGDEIQAIKDSHPERFRIRWSSDVARQDGAIVIDHVPDKPRTENRELVCPGQTDVTACCATCALCWSKEFTTECIAFIKHGPKSDNAHALAVARSESGRDQRRVQAITFPTVKPVPVADAPEIRHVKPTDLIVEESYQRELSGKSIGLIKKIIAGWNWAKYKLPVCAESADGLFVIDGQHTAIAAASHPHVVTIPVMVVKRDIVAQRADAFVSQNTNRLAMSPLQIFHAEVVAGSKDAIEILKSTIRAGGTIPKAVPVKGRSESGQITAITAVRRVLKADGIAKLDRLLKIAILSGLHPVNSTLVYALQYLVRGGYFDAASSRSDEEIADAIKRLTATCALDQLAEDFATDSNQNRYRAAAVLIATEIECPLGSQ